MFMTALMVLSLHFTDIPLQEAGQTSAPIQINLSSGHRLWESATCGNDVYVGKDKRYHIGWWAQS